MPKGSALSRAVRFFKEGDEDECRVALTLVQEIMAERIAGGKVKHGVAVARKKRVRRAASGDTGVSGTEAAKGSSADAQV